MICSKPTADSYTYPVQLSLPKIQIQPTLNKTKWNNVDVFLSPYRMMQPTFPVLTPLHPILQLLTIPRMFQCFPNSASIRTVPTTCNALFPITIQQSSPQHSRPCSNGLTTKKPLSYHLWQAKLMHAFSLLPNHLEHGESEHCFWSLPLGSRPGCVIYHLWALGFRSYQWSENDNSTQLIRLWWNTRHRTKHRYTAVTKLIRFLQLWSFIQRGK